MNAYYTNQYISTTLASVGGIDDSATTGIILASVTNITTDKPGIACLSYTDPIDTSKAEWITYTSIDSGTKELQGVTRGQEDFSAKAHANGVTVSFPLSKSHINNLNDALIIGGAETNLVTGVIDDDSMATASATTLATSESTKAYVDNGTWLKDSLARQAIINGNFDVWQRGTSFTAPANNAYTSDRWTVPHSSDAVVDILRSTDVPTIAQSGAFSNYSLQADVTTADATIAAGQYYNIRQNIEGYNVPGGFGQTGIRYVTLSFWVKATKVGVYCVGFINGGFDRSYVAEYTINTTDTWEKKIITIPVDTTGTWLHTDGVGLRVNFAVACGSTYQTSANTWTTGIYNATSNQVNGLDNAANNFRIAQVQLCAGDVALPFMPKSYEEELRACQRYYLTFFYFYGITGGTDTTIENGLIPTPVTMRANPTVTTDSGVHYAYGNGSFGQITALTNAACTVYGNLVNLPNITVSTGITAFIIVLIRTFGFLSAEL